MTALVTPFKNGELDLRALEKLIDLHLTEGTDGLVLLGTTAESPTLTEAEQDTIVEIAVRRAKGRCPLVAGAGSNCTAKTVQRAVRARELGADALMLVAPYYNKPTQQGLFEHFGRVAERVNLPIMLYNIPGRCAVEIHEDTIGRLCESFDHITAVKHATGSVDGASSLRARCAVDIMSGDDPLTLPLMAVGAVGVVSVLSNLLPRKVRALTEAALSGDFSGALAVHHELYPLAKALLSLEVNPLPIKTAMAMKGLIQEEFRLPMCPMHPDNRERLRLLLKGAELL